MLLKLDGSGPLSSQLYRALCTAILRGRLPPGARLPSTRTLAAEMGLSRNTVLLAYEQLLSEGYAAGRHGSGTYVPTELPHDVAALLPDGHATTRSPRLRAPHFSRFAQTIRSWEVTWAPRETRAAYDFRYGGPALDFPHATWRRALGRRLRKASPQELDYGPPAGASELRAVVADYVQRSRGVHCRPDQIVIVRGSQQGLDLTARVLLDPGDAVLIEEPSYPGARAVFAAAGARILPAAVAPDGMDIDAGAAASRARLAYVTPSHQFPTGAIMSAARRLALLAWAERAGAYVIEDDYDSEYRYVGRPIAALQGLDRRGRVIYLGTFSKLLFPALRLGYVILPEPLLKPFVAAKALEDTGGGGIEQLALADFIRDGHFERHIRRSRLRNGARRKALLAAIRRHLGERVEVSGANAGLHVLLWLHQRAARQAHILRRIEAAGVRVYPITPFYQSPPDRLGFLLGYASLTESDIAEGVRRLATAV